MGGAPVPAHRVICCARSEVMCAMLAGPFKEGATAEVHIPGVQRRAFLELLRFMYTERIDLSAETVVHVCSLADKYMMPIMHTECMRFLGGPLSIDMFWPVISSATALDHVPAFEVCRRFVVEHAGEVICASPGRGLSAQALKRLLEDL